MNPTDPYCTYNTITQLGLRAKTLQSIKAINRVLIIDKNSPAFTLFKNNKVISLEGTIGDVEHFVHPLVLNNKVYVDCRNYYTGDGLIRNRFERDFLLARAFLDLAWVENKDIFYPIENFVTDAFATWTANGIQQSTGCSLLQVIQIKIVASIYYLSLFSTEHIYHDEDILAFIIKKVPKILNLPQTVLLDLIEAFPDALTNLYKAPHAPDAIRIKVFSDTLNIIFENSIKFDPYFIFNAVCRNPIMVANAVEVATISMEHPPTFMAMLIHATDRNFQLKTALGRVVVSISKRYDVKTFQMLRKEYADV